MPLTGLEPLVTIERADALQRQERAAKNALDAVVYALGAGAVVDQQLFGSDPAAAILYVAAVDVDLLVLGSRAYGPVRRALAGSVSSGAVRHAPCPVLLTPRLSDGAG
jgi:nucleotide-binding universal stress UspA family protein